MPAAASLAAAVAVWRHHGISGGCSAAGAALLLHPDAVGTMTPAATAMAGAQTTINNQLNVVTAMVMTTTINVGLRAIEIAYRK